MEPSVPPRRGSAADDPARPLAAESRPASRTSDGRDAARPGPCRRARLGGVSSTLVVVVLLLVLSSILAAPARGQDAERGLAREIELSGTIDPASAAWVGDALAEARRDGADLVVIRLDTPGGLDTSMRDIVRAITASPVPVVVHVAPNGARAASAGLFVVQAADVAVMAPGTNIGAASPVSLSGGDTDEVLGRKIENDAAAYVRALAEVHGRDADLAEDMVRDAVSVTAERARAAGLIDRIAGRDELMERLDGFEIRGPKARTLETARIAVESREMPWHVQVRQALVNPSLSYLLLVGGVLLLGIEFLSPGLIGPGLFGAVALVIGLYGTAQLPVTVGGVVLLVLGLGFLMAEIHIASGVLGVAGVVALVVGGLLLYDTESDALAVTVPVAIAAGLLLGGFFLFIAGKAMSLRRRPPRGEPGQELIGQVASVRSALDPTGQIYVGGALWRARANSGAPVKTGQRVIVDAVEGLTLIVHPSSEPEASTKESTWSEST